MEQIYLIGEVGYEITLKNVIEAVKNTDEKKDLLVNIHSVGGSVQEGLAIYNYLKNLDRTIHTASCGLVASISSVIFLAGKKETRKINETDSFLIHLPMALSGGNASDLEKTAKQLRDVENTLADIYVKETNLTREEAMEQMKKDDFMENDYLIEKGFISEVSKLKAVASMNNFNIKNKMSEAVTKKDLNTMFDGFFNKLKSVFLPKNKIVQDATGDNEIDFYELEEDATPIVGDKAMVGEEDANGSFVMPNGETYVFESGVLTEIIVADEEEEEDGEDELEALKQENESLKQQLVDSQNLLADEKTKSEGLNAKLKDSQDKVEEIKVEFVEFKNTIVTKFEEGKQGRNEGGTTTTRTLRKKG